MRLLAPWSSLLQSAQFSLWPFPRIGLFISLTSRTSFVDVTYPDHVCRLNKSLYGLKQTPRACYSRFATYLLSLGFVEAKSDTSLFIYRRGSDTVYLLLYVDDIVLTASSTSLLRSTISALQTEFQ